jgi:hypothetical protein
VVSERSSPLANTHASADDAWPLFPLTACAASLRQRGVMHMAEGDRLRVI